MASLPPPPPPPNPGDHRVPPPWAAPRPAGTSAGWYSDPWGAAAYRWWDGGSWTPSVTAPSAVPPGAAPLWNPPARRRRLPEWLSIPVLCTAPLTVLIVIVVVAREPVAFPLAVVPLVILVPVWLWVDRLEPEPRAARLHALLWGATVAIASGAVGGGLLYVATGENETISMVIAAPVTEETAKGLGILWAVRRKRVDGPLDGLVYACWVATGFAMVENMLYFFIASDGGALTEMFVARGLLTPFAHPMFTVWLGLAIGMAVAKRQPLPGAALWGWLAAMACHAIWNGLLTLTATAEEPVHQGMIGLFTISVFIAMFTLAIVVVVRTRGAQRDQYFAAMPSLLLRYRIPPGEVGMFRSWEEFKAARRTLGPEHRRRFDRTHAALARLAALHARPGPPDPSDEQRLVVQLTAARHGER